MDDLISVIVPIYNIEEYLPRCLRAISEQTYSNLEIILVDDGSTDGSGRLCDDFAAKDPRARVIHKPKDGLPSARNAGQDAANGNYLFFPDGDDYFHREIIQILYDALQENDTLDLAACRYLPTNKQDEDVSFPVFAKGKEISGQEALLIFYHWKYSGYNWTMWNKLFRRSLINDIRTRPFLSQDKDFMIQIFPHIRKAVLINEALYYYVQRPTSIVHQAGRARIVRRDCVSMCFQNYKALQDKQPRLLADYLLKELYVSMAFSKAESQNTPIMPTVSTAFRSIEKDTWKAFLRSGSIPLWKRVFSLLLLHLPRLTQWLMKVTNNWSEVD